ncbi:20948_t:CDS:2 [Dentiscutata erythropus]|uniref:20948_t:CDS:1 n=1 Tax=Dentiscutata erythropus TaxID=1348616 RepID=A0A9N9BBU8_9GLOM|nr:20948_t:CDS:2 [Dentiscutata erythropus]
MKISGGTLKNYSKTRWTTASETIESVLNLEKVLKKIVEDNILTNDQINKSNNTTLGDCFLSLAKTSATIKKLLIQQYAKFRQYCINILNKRFEEFDNDLYLLGYFLMPNFRSNSIWLKFGNTCESGNILIAHLQLYKEKKYLYDKVYIQGHDIPIIWWNSIEPEPEYLQELALKILAIVPNSVSCERNFSLLTWLTGNKRTQIDIQNLESIAKLCTYYNSNAKKELSYFANEITEDEVLKILNQTNINTFEERLEKEGFDKDQLLLINNIDVNETHTTTKENLNLLLETNEILENINEETNQILEQDNYDDYDWDPKDFINSDDD